jgi:hypothetical protein
MVYQSTRPQYAQGKFFQLFNVGAKHDLSLTLEGGV